MQTCGYRGEWGKESECVTEMKAFWRNREPQRRLHAVMTYTLRIERPSKNSLVMDLWSWWDTTSGYLFSSHCTHYRNSQFLMISVTCRIYNTSYSAWMHLKHKPTGSDKAVMTLGNGKLQGCEMVLKVGEESLASMGKIFGDLIGRCDGDISVGVTVSSQCGRWNWQDCVGGEETCQTLMNTL